MTYEHFPEPEEREPVNECDICEKPLFKGDTVYKFLKRRMCEECVENAREIIGED